MDDEKDIVAEFSYNTACVFTNDLPCIADANIYIDPYWRKWNEDCNDNIDVIAIRRRNPNPPLTPHDFQCLLKFDVSAIQVGAKVQSAELNLYCWSVPPNPYGYEFQKLTSDWVESPINNVLTVS